MFDRDQLAAYLRTCSDADLRAAVVRVRLWQLRLYDEPSRLRGLLGRVLAVVHEEFGERGWNRQTTQGNYNFPPGSVWHTIHSAVWQTLNQMHPTDRSAAQVPSEIAEWLAQVNAVAA